MRRVHVPGTHYEVLFANGVVCLEPIIPSFLQFVLKRLHVHIHILPRIVGPWNYQRHENILSLHNLPGGEIEWNDKHGPTAVCGCHLTKHTEPICADGDSRMPWICRFFLMKCIEALQRSTIRSVC